MDSLRHIAENKIQQAMKDGLFDNLPGKGKPLRLDDDPFEEPAWRMANHLLKDQGFSLPWIEVRKEIEAELASIRSELAAAARRSLAHGGNSLDWQDATAKFRNRALDLNRRIMSYNLQAPLDRFQLRLLNVDAEIEMAKS